MEQLKDRLVAVIAGLVLAYAAISITGIGAAIAIPAAILKPVAQVSVLLAFSLVDLFTIALPLGAAFLLMALFSRWLVKRPDFLFYVLLLAPLLLSQLYFLLQPQPPELLNVIKSLPSFVVLLTCFYLLVRTRARPDA
jgi:hypothetical protein